MSPTILHRVRLLLIPLIAMLALPGTSFAAPPLIHERFEFTGEGELCGVTGTNYVTGVDLVWEDEDSFRASGQVTREFTATDGRSVVLRAAGPFAFTSTENDDGTITFVEDYRGLPESISGSQGGPVLRDAGLITIITTVDAETFDLISQDFIIHGPHPEADSGFSLFCDAVLEALGE